jgi:L-ascorbate metabolism protein UlaG (beta-lactamase superfamily)
VLALVEIANELSELGVETVHDHNLGGTVGFDWGWVKLVPAWHSSTTPNGTVSPAAGLLIMVGETLVYHLGDTALFSDLKLIAQRGNHVNVALVPIGGHYTMDRFDAVTACEWVGADTVIPIHYDTFPPIETDAEAFKTDVENATETRSSSWRPARRTPSGDPRDRPHRGGARGDAASRRGARRRRRRRRGLVGDG